MTNLELAVLRVAAQMQQTEEALLRVTAHDFRSQAEKDAAALDLLDQMSTGLILQLELLRATQDETDRMARLVSQTSWWVRLKFWLGL
jgi:signal transduction histidine kinase